MEKEDLYNHLNQHEGIDPAGVLPELPSPGRPSTPRLCPHDGASVLEQEEVRGRRWPHTSLPLQEDLGPRLMTTQWSHQPATLPQSSHTAGSPSSNPTKHQCSSGHTETTTHSGQAKLTEIQGGR